MTAPAAVFSARTAKPVSRVFAAVVQKAARFTIDGDVMLEQHLATTCARIAAGLRGLLPTHKLEAVLLGGGYGRGEGGVLQTVEGDRPYNDLEFYVCLRGNRHLNERRFGRALHVFGEILTPQAGVDVEFCITSIRDLAAAEVSMFSYDLISGHRWLIGNDELLNHCEHHRDAEAIPLFEATRLLMNRCSGLLFSAERLARSTFTPADADFVGRNIAKAQLGLGDAVLTAFHDYHWSVRERHRLLERLARVEGIPWLPSVWAHHREGTEFKLHPTRSSAEREELASRHAVITGVARDVWRWLESRRLGVAFNSIEEYTDTTRPKCPGPHRLRNILVNAKVLGPATSLRGEAFRHPRERVLNTLPQLLWDRDVALSPEQRQRLQRELATSATDFPGFVTAYRKIWSRVN